MTTEDRPTDSVSAPRVAVVGGRPIPVSRLERRVRDARRGPRGRHVPPDAADPGRSFGRWLVQELVTEAVIAHEARAAGLGALTPETLSRLVELVTASVTVPDHEVRAYYERNRDLYARPERRTVVHVVAPDRAAIEAIVEAGLTPADGIDVRRGELAGALEEAIFAARIGDLVGPIQTELGWHLARVEAVTAETVVPFDVVRPGIEAELLGAARAQAFGAWLESRRKELAVVEPAYAHPGDPIHGIPSHRH